MLIYNVDCQERPATGNIQRLIIKVVSSFLDPVRSESPRHQGGKETYVWSEIGRQDGIGGLRVARSRLNEVLELGLQ